MNNDNSMTSPPCDECRWFDSGKCYADYNKGAIIRLNNALSDSYCNKYITKSQDD